jgi:hypothetical protein
MTAFFMPDMETSEGLSIVESETKIRGGIYCTTRTKGFSQSFPRPARH